MEKMYSRIATIGVGGYGNVWLGERDGKTYAIKTTNLGRTGIVNINEFVIMRNVKQNNIMPMIDYYILDDTANIVMEVADCDLSAMCKYEKGGSPLNIDKFLRIAYQMLIGLATLHSVHIIHGDIKASNVMMYGNTPKIGDFSLSIRSNLPVYYENGTMTHKSPERINALGWHKPTDIWSLGCTFYEILFGKLLIPFQGPHSSKDAASNYLRRYSGTIQYFCKYNEFNADNSIPESKEEYAMPDSEYRKYISPKHPKHMEYRKIVAMIFSMLNYNPKKRPTAAELLEHEIFVGIKSEYSFFREIAFGESPIKEDISLEVSNTASSRIISITNYLYNSIPKEVIGDKRKLYIQVCTSIANKLNNSGTYKLANINQELIKEIELSIVQRLDFRLYNQNLYR